MVAAMNDVPPSTDLTQEASSFLRALFDLSFSELITTRVVKTVYIIVIVVAGLMTVAFILSSLFQGFGMGLLALILGPLFFLLYVCAARIWLELVIVIFRIGEHVRNLDARRVEPTTPPPII